MARRASYAQNGAPQKLSWVFVKFENEHFCLTQWLANGRLFPAIQPLCSNRVFGKPTPKSDHKQPRKTEKLHYTAHQPQNWRTEVCSVLENCISNILRCWWPGNSRSASSYDPGKLPVFAQFWAVLACFGVVLGRFWSATPILQSP